MRNITVFRKKRFVGCLINYYCVVNVNKDDYQDYIDCEMGDKESQNDEQNIYSYSISPISNGEGITLNIEDSESTLFVAAHTSSGIVFSNEVIIEACRSNLSYLLVTKYSISKGSSYILTEILSSKNLLVNE